MLPSGTKTGAWRMAWAKSLAAFVGIVCFALAGWAVFLPGSHDTLDRIGVLGPMRSLGLPVAEADQGGGGGRRGFGGGDDIAVVVKQTAMQEADSRLSAIGTSRPARSVTLRVDVTGTLIEIPIASGDWVEAGSRVARLNAESQELARDRAELGLRDAQSRLDRVAQLRGSGSASQVQIDEAELALSRAELDLRIAQYELERREIIAPISGWIGLITLEEGNLITANSEFVRVDDRSTLLIDFDIPERHVGRISAGDSLRASPLSRPGDALNGQIRAVDARVDQDSRALRLQAEISNDDDLLRPGMAFRVQLDLPGESLPSIDPLAIQWDRDGAFVWALGAEDRVSRVRIEIAQRRDASVLVRGDLEPGTFVVTEGVQNLRPGATVAPRQRLGPDGAVLEDAAIARSQPAQPEI
ncbi:MAG: efflux RND transporter periplasmic adaptor subunit [Rhodobacteraceae bacterium]|nr:MAG: efflux RND transporter periplasmic adaptor subunit [Paracoccaceae bacterium]